MMHTTIRNYHRDSEWSYLSLGIHISSRSDQQLSDLQAIRIGGPMQWRLSGLLSIQQITSYSLIMEYEPYPILGVDIGSRFYQQLSDLHFSHMQGYSPILYHG